MNGLTDIIFPGSVDVGIPAPNKKALFQQLAAAAARATDIPAKQILAAINEREKLGSTGFGGGVAIPHGKIDGLANVTGYFARLQAPVDYQSIDGLPVDLVFLLLSPTDAGADHLKALAGVSRLFRDRDMVAKLKGARSEDAIFALLATADARDAA